MAGGLRDRVLDAFGAAVAAVLLAALAYRAWRETGEANSYALLADAFRHGRLSVPRCFDIDCVVRDGATYVIFPPVPGVAAMPFVAAFGVGFAGFVALGWRSRAPRAGAGGGSPGKWTPGRTCGLGYWPLFCSDRR